MPSSSPTPDTSSPATESSTASATPTEVESTSATSSSSTNTEPSSATPSSSPQETEETTPDGPQGDEQEPRDPKVSEAKKYRQRAQQAEAERDQLRDELTALKHSTIAGALTGHGVTIDALTAAGHDPASFFDGGSVDQEKLRSAARETADRFGIRVGVIPTQGTGPSDPRTETRSGKTWTEAFDEAGTPYHRLGGNSTKF